uniref:Uncharacterized protein n=1 Tax=Lygus hesperus TaxID=30085 RepID=A0A0K8SCY5_LYGHE
MSFYWQNGRRIQRRGQDSMMGLAGSTRHYLPDATIRPDNKVAAEDSPALKIENASGSADEKTKRTMKSDEGHRNRGRASLENSIDRVIQLNHSISFIDELRKDFDCVEESSNIHVFFEELHKNFGNIHDTFRNSDDNSLQSIKVSPPIEQNITFFDGSSSENVHIGVICEDRTGFWCSDIMITRPPSYTEQKHYYVDPSEIEKRINQVIYEIEKGSLHSSSIEGDDSDSETDSKPGSCDQQ